MKYTKYNNLNLPDLTDQYNLKHWNENTEKIDDKLNEHQVKLDTSTPENTASTLAFRNEQGKLKVSTPLEQDDTNMAVNIDYLINTFRTKMLDEAHPKGEVYYTEDKNFDPNVSWVGTWVRIKNRFIWAIGDNDGNAGDTGGSVKIKAENLPKHTHEKGSLSVDNGGKHTHSVPYDKNDSPNDHAPGTLAPHPYDGSYYSTIKGYTQIYSSGSHSHTISGSTGNGGFANTDYMPPYEKAYCWKRTE